MHINTHIICVQFPKLTWSDPPKRVMLIQNPLSFSKVTSGLCLLEGFAHVCYFGGYEASQNGRNSKENISLHANLVIQVNQFFFVNQDICKCFIGFGPDSSVTNALLCGAGDVSAQQLTGSPLIIHRE